MTVRAHLESAGGFPRLDSLARAGPASLLIDGHRDQDYTCAVTLENAQIVGVDSRAPARRGRQVRPIPKAKWQKLRICQKGFADDFTNRRVEMFECRAPYRDDVGKSRRQPSSFTVTRSRSTLVLPVFDARKVLIHLSRRPTGVTRCLF